MAAAAKPTAAKAKLPRGIRNNNPLNIRIGNVWLGEVTENTDGAFEQFISMQYGVRAAAVLLRRYINHYKRRTVRQIISAWAPANENNTTAYVNAVAKRMGIDPDATIKFTDKHCICQLIAAMAHHENGRDIDYNTIEKGYDMA